MTWNASQLSTSLQKKVQLCFQGTITSSTMQTKMHGFSAPPWMSIQKSIFVCPWFRRRPRRLETEENPHEPKFFRRIHTPNQKFRRSTKSLPQNFLPHIEWILPSHTRLGQNTKTHGFLIKVWMLRKTLPLRLAPSRMPPKCFVKSLACHAESLGEFARSKGERDMSLSSTNTHTHPLYSLSSKDFVVQPTLTSVQLQALSFGKYDQTKHRHRPFFNL